MSVAVKVFGKRVEGIEGAVKKGLLSACQRGVTDIVSNVIPKTLVLEHTGIRLAPPIDRGLYKSGFRAEATPTGARIRHVNPMMAAVMENGVRAGNVKIGRAMIRALTSWAHRKGLEAPKKSPESVAWAIAKNAQRYGIAPRHVFKREMQRIPAFAQSEVSRFVRQFMEETRRNPGG